MKRGAEGASDDARLKGTILAVQRGVHWLKEKAPQLSDARGISITISALVQAERNPHSHLVQRLATNLAIAQRPNGSWNDELWDTTWGAKALLASGFSKSDPLIQRALQFCRSIQDKVDGTWYEEPWETMLVLDLVSDADPALLTSIGKKPISWLESLQREDGLLVGARYTGMAVSLFAGLPPKIRESHTRVIRRGLSYLRVRLTNRGIWTDAAWSNYYGLRALSDTESTLGDPEVDKAVDWFLRKQEGNGRWLQVSEVHDTAMATMILSRLLSAPLVEVTPPRLGVLTASREDGTMRITFQGPEAGAMVLSDSVKVSKEVRRDLGQNQQRVLQMTGWMRASGSRSKGALRPSPTPEELVRIGRYTFGHLVPASIQSILEHTTADHVRLDVDERLIDLPWELVHDGLGYLCLRYALGRRMISNQPFAQTLSRASAPEQTRALVVADTTGDLPAAELEGRRVAGLLKTQGMSVDHFSQDELKKRDFLLALSKCDIVHFAGHASHEKSHPDESFLAFSDGRVRAFEIARFCAARAPPLVFLNACWSGEESRKPDALSPTMRSLSRTFLFAGVSAFVGYLVPVPDESATKLAVEFYSRLAEGNTIGESLRQARVTCRESSDDRDLTWASAVLYGDPTVRAIESPAPRPPLSP